MENYIFEKAFTFKDNIEKVSNILLDNDFKNFLVEEGVEIKGNIYITFFIHENEKKDYEALTIPVELFISINKVDSLKELKLNIVNFEYVIDQNKITFKVYTKLMGNNEDFISFEPTKNRSINEEMVNLLMRNDESKQTFDFDEGFLKNVESFLKKDNVDLISTPYENLDLKQDDIIEISSLEEESNELEINKVPQEESEINFKEQNNVIEQKEEIEKEIEKKDIIESTTEEKAKEITINNVSRNKTLESENADKKINNTLKDEDVAKKENKNDKELFKEIYASNYFYYRLKENETIDDLAKMFKIDKQEISSLNKNVTFKKGQLIKIKK